MNDLRLRTITGFGFGVIVILASLAPWPIFTAVILVGFAIAAVELYRLRDAGAVALVQWAILLGGLYSLLQLKGMSDLLLSAAGGWQGPPLIFIAVAPTWAGDVAAYLVGSRYGRRKLVPWISPGKTWEGTIAGFVAAGALAVGLASWSGLPNVTWLGLLVGPAALAGDLLESTVKRCAGVKDSGTLFPGHGGMLDRIDSLVAVAMLVTAIYVAPSLG